MTTTKDRGPRAGTATETPTKTKGSGYIHLDPPIVVGWACWCGVCVAQLPDRNDGHDMDAVLAHRAIHRADGRRAKAAAR